MAAAEGTTPAEEPTNTPLMISHQSTRTSPSTFERVICSNPPILDSLFAQITTQDALHLYHTSPHLRTSLRDLPTAWRFISWRLYQPLAVAPAANQNNPNAPKQSSNYALDQLLINVINPYSTCLQSLELDNTAVSGGTLTQTVLILRRDTLQHLSVRGCKNVSLKYHINPWLQMHALAQQGGPPGQLYPYDKLALKSLYTYRCRHHRRRPYLPSSLARKESDSEPTHELVKTCHLLGIWTDTAWCTTPGSRCFRRRGYVTMRSPQDPREVWVVFDRLWRSKNWLGPIDSNNSNPPKQPSRKQDPRFWEVSETARKGEAVGLTGEGKEVPMHLRVSHRRFVDDVYCHNCDAQILERCEQCSIMMHCAGCRKTLCASCAFDRPYLRNKNAPEQDRNRFWWAPGCAVSPCSMQDSDVPIPVGNPPNAAVTSLPNIRFKWCCTEPVFSGGGGISFPSASNRSADSIRAAPLPRDQGWEEPDFVESDDHKPAEGQLALASKWRSLPDFFMRNLDTNEHGTLQVSPPIPRMLCDDCHSSDKWRINCKACSLPLCIKHDMCDRMKVRICGSRDLSIESREYLAQKRKWDQKWEKINEQLRSIDIPRNGLAVDALQQALATSDPAVQPTPRASPERVVSLLRQSFLPLPSEAGPSNAQPAPINETRTDRHTQPIEVDLPQRPQSRGSNCSDTISRSSSPAPSAATPPITPEPKSVQRKAAKKDLKPSLDPPWQGCKNFFCPIVRPAGDHRRRCVAVMRQCSECRVNVCEDCIGGMEEPCPCRGCKVPTTDTGTTIEAQLFFCSNCRWSRMASGKCRRYTETYLAAQAAQAGRSRRFKKPSKLRRSLESRSPSSGGAAVPDEAAVLLSEFSEMRLEGALLRGSTSSDLSDLTTEEEGEIEEIENVGHLARELITRIQGLRGQFRPGSMAALALPDVRLMDDAQSIILNAPIESDSSDEPSSS